MSTPETDEELRELRELREWSRCLEVIDRRNQPSARQDDAESPGTIATFVLDASDIPPAIMLMFDNQAAIEVSSSGHSQPVEQREQEFPNIFRSNMVFMHALSAITPPTLDDTPIFAAIPGSRPQAESTIYNDADPQNETLYIRKAVIKELLLLVEPSENNDTCFCYAPYTITTATGDSHAPVKMPGCGHVFGKLCIAKWLQDKITCPMCRDTVVLPSLARNISGGVDSVREVEF